MSTSGPGIGYGTTVRYGDGGSPESFTVLARVVDVPGPGFETDFVEVTNQDSPAGAGSEPWKEFIAGAKEVTEFELDILLIENNVTQVRVEDDQLGGVKRNWRVIKPGGYGWQFAAFVSFSEGAPLGDKMTKRIKFRPTGAPTRVTP